MKFIRTVLIIAIFSMALSALYYYLADNVVKTASWEDEIGEIATVGAFIFAFFLILYVIVKSLAKGARAVGKKKPSQPGRP